MTSRHYGFTLRISTWATDSSILYDYESQNVCSKTYRCQGKHGRYRVLKRGSDVQLMSEESGIEWLVSDLQVRTLLKLESAGPAGYKIEGVGTPDEDDEVRRAYTKRRRDGGGRRRTIKKTEQTTDDLNDENPPNEDLLTPPGGTGAPPEDPDSQALWLVVRSLNKGSVILKENDVIKLGRFTFKVRQLVCSEDDLKSASSSEPRPFEAAHAFQARQSLSPLLVAAETEPSYDSEAYHETEEETAAGDSHGEVENVLDRARCRFCLCDDFDPIDDPLISPCSCKGSLKWVHLKCLRTWMLERLHFKESSPCFFWKPLECELCQETYPAYISVLDEYRETSSITPTVRQRKSSADLPATTTLDHYQQILNSSRGIHPSLPPEARLLFICPTAKIPFLILESKQTDGFHVLNFGQRPVLRLGRGHEADVRLADISISRVHTILRYRQLITETKSTGFQSVVVMEDCRSKFGTLIKWRRETPVTAQPKSVVSFQVGRTVLTVFVKQPTFSRLLSACWLDRLPRFRNREPSSSSPTDDGQDVRLLNSTYENTT